MRFKIYVVLLLLTTLVSCKQNQKFDKTKWNLQEDLKTYPYRNSMLNDLTKNNQLSNLTKQQTIEKLGLPDDTSSNIFFYNIITDYGNDIDPVYTKTLEINFRQDNTIITFKVSEWKK